MTVADLLTIAATLLSSSGIAAYAVAIAREESR